MSEGDRIIDVRDLRVSYRSGQDRIDALRGVSFFIARGETVAIVGESGSGKSTLAHAVIGLLPANANVTGGEISVRGRDFTSVAKVGRLGVRGQVAGLIPQDPAVSLNPTMRIGAQIGEALTKARGVHDRGIAADTEALLEQVGLDHPARRARQYPHELSGGMRQRVLIAIALARNPPLIIADEPTSALDVTVQRRILDHLSDLASTRGIALLIITHDLGVAADRASRVMVMKDGQIVEEGPPRDILTAPAQNHTRDLIAAAPLLGGRARLAAGWRRVPAGPELLRFEGISKEFDLPRLRGQAPRFRALDDVSFTVPAGQTLAVVGESGSGKTTLCRIALGLEKPNGGKVFFEGRDITGLSGREFRPLRRRIQLVQQNPFAALDPRFTVHESIVEPLVSFRLESGRGLAAAAARLIDSVHLPRAVLERRPKELSGGQRQRVAIARALALRPDLLFLDEPVSALDVSVQARILALLKELQEDLKLSYVLVSHDLSVVAAVAHRVVVMRKGKVVEQGLIDAVFGTPSHPYTKDLLDAIPGSLSQTVNIHRDCNELALLG